MSIAANDNRKQEALLQAGDHRRLCPQRYQPGAVYAGV